MLTANRTTPLEIVVIGASTGAVEALHVLLPLLADGLSVPVVVVVHLPANHRSLLPEIFAPLCQAPVREPLDKEPVAGGVIWFAPADYHLLIESERSFAFSVDAPVKYSRPAVDVLFESAARAYGPGVTGVVLTGASEDGADGAATIRTHGGCVYVQDPAEAEAKLMPMAAIRLAAPQYIGTLTGIAKQLRASTGWCT
ncbi:MAG TPA: chemotaxis protein CheB [Polyangiales bacterium]|nr:chemotaxis protein CheB [Polyangiales bacterium]